MSDFDSNPFADPEAGNPFAVSDFLNFIFANIIMIIDLENLTAKNCQNLTADPVWYSSDYLKIVSTRCPLYVEFSGIPSSKLLMSLSEAGRPNFDFTSSSK